MNDAFLQNFLAYSMTSALFAGFFAIVFGLLIWLILRPFWCWYFKINQHINLLTEIRDSLLEIKSNASDTDSSQLDAKIERVYSDSGIDAEIGSNIDVTPPLPVSKCNIDKPMQPCVADKKWMPPKNTK